MQKKRKVKTAFGFETFFQLSIEKAIFNPETTASAIVENGKWIFLKLVLCLLCTTPNKLLVKFKFFNLLFPGSDSLGSI